VPTNIEEFFMSDFIIEDADISEEFKNKVNAFSKRFTAENAVVFDDMYKHMYVEAEEIKSARIITVDDKALITEEITEKQKTMIELTELWIKGRTKGLAKEAGWTDRDLRDQVKIASKEYLQFSFDAASGVPYFNLVYSTIHTYRSIDEHYNVPVIECLSKIANSAAGSFTLPFKQILDKLAGSKEVTESVNKLMENFWGKTHKDDPQAIFSISPAWKRDGSVAVTFSSSASNYIDDNWRKFLLGKVGTVNTFYAAAFAAKYLENMWSAGGWEETLRKMFLTKDPNYMDRFASQVLDLD